MTDPKDKAQELWLKMEMVQVPYNSSAKEAAEVAVDEIIELLEDFNYYENAGRADTYGVSYWKKVKEEIQKL